MVLLLLVLLRLRPMVVACLAASKDPVVLLQDV